MNDLNTFLPMVCLGVGGWNLVNGILHDVFILAQKRKYDRDLLRLLMDGHILITCGVIQLVTCKVLYAEAVNPFMLYMSIISSASILVYCFMILPFLKSFVTMLLNLLLLV